MEGERGSMVKEKEKVIEGGSKRRREGVTYLTGVNTPRGYICTDKHF